MHTGVESHRQDSLKCKNGYLGLYSIRGEQLATALTKLKEGSSGGLMAEKEGQSFTVFFPHHAINYQKYLENGRVYLVDPINIYCFLFLFF